MPVPRGSCSDDCMLSRLFTDTPTSSATCWETSGERVCRDAHRTRQNSCDGSSERLLFEAGIPENGSSASSPHSPLQAVPSLMKRMESHSSSPTGESS